MKDFIKGLVRESMEFHMLETLMGEDYPSTFSISEFRTLKTFSQRIQYCQQHLKRIAAGSSRLVFMVDNTKVLKLAKNNKGIEQNMSEIDWKDDGYYKDILAQVLDYDENGLWVEMELARKVTPAIFQKQMGVTIREFEEYITLTTYENNGRRIGFKVSDDVKNKLSQDFFTNRLLSFVEDNDATNVIGDFGKLNSYGLVNRHGYDEIVIIDFGLTNTTYDGYYK